MKIGRRELLLGGLITSCALAAGRFLGLKTAPKPIPGGIVGASSARGHKLRGYVFPAPSHIAERDVVIVGGGMAGLAAARRLKKAGETDFVLLELEREVGGNSASGRNSVSAYPWGAHYVPPLTEEAEHLRTLFEELNVITGYDGARLPIYNEYFICSDPHERLFIYGAWQEGLIPVVGLAPEEHIQFKRFFTYTDNLKRQRGRDGKRLFAIPVDLSSQDEEWLALDALTMRQWMDNEGYTSPHLRWYVDYSCRDDYGTSYTEISAWVGLHYYAARNGAASNMEPANVITWPEGNGWIATRLAEAVQDNIVANALVHSVSDHHDHATVDYFNVETGATVRIKARAVILATPRFVSAHLLQSDRLSISAKEFSYAPWAVANITLSAMPAGKGAALSWDNVIYNSPLLGYVVATHQITQMRPTKTVITYYWPLSHLPPAEARKEALARSYQEWQGLILKELLRVHPELEGKVEQFDIWLWGHAMVRPTPGFMWGETRKAALEQHAPVFTAHSDMSGISVFEEAYTHGLRAAENAINHLHAAREGTL